MPATTTERWLRTSTAINEQNAQHSHSSGTPPGTGRRRPSIAYTRRSGLKIRW
jgi:hypothetical protein